MKELVLRNRRRVDRLDLRFFRRVARGLLEDLLEIESYQIGVQWVGRKTMARMNERFLGHHGSTDVITFDYREGQANETLHGELYICADEAREQARRYQTRWQEEIVRYWVHGILHLLGFDDQTAGRRRIMKREEVRLLLELKKRFPLDQLAPD